MNSRRPAGMFGFTIVWIGQVVSLIGSAMTGFAMTIWAWQITGQATALALVGFFNFAPSILFTPIAGALVDRWNRKLVMMLSDLASGLTTIIILILYAAGSLQIWHLYLLGAISGIFQAFQWPAYSAAISTMIPKEQLARAAGMMSLAEWGSGIFAPVLAGTLLGFIGLTGILTIDIVTFIFAIGALLFVFIPQPVETQEGRESRGGLWKEITFGFRYILQRPSLLGLQMVFFFGNLLSTLGGMLINPMILARTGSNAALLGIVQSAGSAGGIAGSALITAWGGPKRKINGVLGGWILSGLLGATLFGINGGLVVWIVASFMGSFFGPVINSSNQAIWQSKTPPDIQGKVFSVRRLIAQITAPLAMALAGPLADYVFEPSMRAASNPLQDIFGTITGTGIGAGMAVILFTTGILTTLVGLIAYSIARIREVEAIMPDYVHPQQETAPTQAD